MSTTNYDRELIGVAYAEAVNQNVRAEVTRAGHNLAAIEPILGKSHPPVQRRLSNQQEWSLSELAMIAHWLIIPVADLTTVRP
jgi:hypothetical protein